MVKHMIQLDPEKRLSVRGYLYTNDWQQPIKDSSTPAPKLFPDSFAFLHSYLSKLFADESSPMSTIHASDANNMNREANAYTSSGVDASGTNGTNTKVMVERFCGPGKPSIPDAEGMIIVNLVYELATETCRSCGRKTCRSLRFRYGCADPVFAGIGRRSG